MFVIAVHAHRRVVAAAGGTGVFASAARALSCSLQLIIDPACSVVFEAEALRPVPPCMLRPRSAVCGTFGRAGLLAICWWCFRQRAAPPSLDDAARAGLYDLTAPTWALPW